MSILFTIPKAKAKYKEPVSIYVRISYTKEFQLFANSGFKVHPRYWNFDTAKKDRLKKNFKPVPRTKTEVEQQIKVLSESTLYALKIEISNRFEIARLNRDRYPVIDSKWLKEVIKDFRNETKRKDKNIFVNFFEDYIDRKDKTTFEPILKRIKEFQKLQNTQFHIIDISSDFSHDYSKWLESKNYTPGYINEELSHIKRVVKDAKKNRFTISELDLDDWTKLKDKEKEELDVVYLNWEEIDKVYNCDVSDSFMLENMKTIFLISCYTGLRFSDVHKVRLEDIKDNKIEITIKKKGNKKLTVPIDPRVRKLLEKKPIKQISNTHFNKHIGTLMKKAGINEMVTSRKREREKDGIHRIAITKKRPKHEVISSHCGRRSFCSNYYGVFRTPVLMALSDHRTESSFLRYIGKTSNDAADIFLKQYFE